MRRKRGLTLTELLIVISIVAILAALTYVVAINIMVRMRLDRCVSNLRQIGIALHMYAQDNDGFIPPYTNVFWKENYRDLIGKEHWVDTTPYLNPAFLEGAFMPYTKNKQIWFCYEDQFSGKDVIHYLIQHKFTSYAISGWIPLLSPVSLDNPPTDIIPPWMMYLRDSPFFELYVEEWKDDATTYTEDKWHDQTNHVWLNIWLRLKFDGRVVMKKVGRF